MPQLFDTFGKKLSGPSSKRWGHDEARNLSTFDILSSLQDRESGHSAAPRVLAAGTGYPSNTSLPPICESGRGMVRQIASPKDWLRPSKRSRSSAAACGARKGAGQWSSSHADNSTAPRSGSESGLPALPSSESAGALTTCQENKMRSHSDVEDVLEIALTLNSNPGARTASKELCCSSEIEAHLQELMDFDSDKENSLSPKKERRARVSDDRGDNESNIFRKGTGFVHLKPSAEKLRDCRVKIIDKHGDNESNIHRKGTGFVHLKPSPEKSRNRRASIVDEHGDNENSICRKGTGFVNLYASPQNATACHARIDDEHGDNENNIQRKGTGFVHLNSPLGEVNTCRAKIVDHHGDNENKLCRKGTGFVHVSAALDKVTDERCVRIQDHHGDYENNIRRKGTGFVNLSALPTEPPAVSFPEDTGGNVNNIQRKGTGFVVLSHLSPRVRIADTHGDNENRIQRKGTGFIDLSDDSDLLPISP